MVKTLQRDIERDIERDIVEYAEVVIGGAVILFQSLPAVAVVGVLSL